MFLKLVLAITLPCPLLFITNYALIFIFMRFRENVMKVKFHGRSFLISNFTHFHKKGEE